VAQHPSSRCSDDSRMYVDTLWVNPCERMIENLKVGDVVKDDDDTEYEIYEMFTRTAVVKCRTYLSLIDLDKLKDYTLVQPEKTLEEKFDDYCNENLSLNTKDLAQIAERHYKELIK